MPACVPASVRRRKIIPLYHIYLLLIMCYYITVIYHVLLNPIYSRFNNKFFILYHIHYVLKI